MSVQKTRDRDFVKRVEEASGQQVSRCYQCGNCSGSCNYTQFYDYPTNQIMRLVQLGQKDVVLSCASIWLCTNCQACSTRCPCNIETARVMEALRVMSREEGKASQKDIRLFYDEFLKSVKRFGRVFEAGLVPTFNLKTGKLFGDMDLVPKVLKKRKLAFKPHNVGGCREVGEIFKRFETYLQKNTAGQE